MYAMVTLPLFLNYPHSVQKMYCMVVVLFDNSFLVIHFNLLRLLLPRDSNHVVRMTQPDPKMT